MHIYARSNSGGKGTKKNPHIQIYAEKSSKFIIFAGKKVGFVTGYRFRKPSIKFLHMRAKEAYSLSISGCWMVISAPGLEK